MLLPSPRCQVASPEKDVAEVRCVIGDIRTEWHNVGIGQVAVSTTPVMGGAGFWRSQGSQVSIRVQKALA